ILRETVGLEVGEAPVRIPEAGTGSICVAVRLDRLIDTADRLQYVSAREVRLVHTRVPADDLVVNPEGRIETSQRNALAGVAELARRAPGKALAQHVRLREGLLELVPAVQYLDVVAAREPVVRRELDAAFKQKLGIVVDEELHAEPREQAHRLDMVRVRPQEFA